MADLIRIRWGKAHHGKTSLRLEDYCDMLKAVGLFEGFKREYARAIKEMEAMHPESGCWRLRSDSPSWL